MSKAEFDFEQVFDADYLYFYETFLTAERTGREIETIWRLLGLAPGMTILDLGCGDGRLALELAKRGCFATGIDGSGVFIEKARKIAVETGLTIDFRQGDMRQLDLPRNFERVLLWSAYGFFDKVGNRQTLARAFESLKSGGKLLIEHPNHDFIIKNFQANSIIERDGSSLIDRTAYVIETGYLHTQRTILRDGKTRQMEFFMVLPTFAELRQELLAVGFSRVQGFSSTGETLQISSPKMLLVAE